MLAFIREPCDESIIRSAPAGEPCSKSRGRWVLAATILASSMAFIDGTVVNVALPALQTTLNATAVDVQWVIEAYSLLLSALLLVGGSLGDHYGRRRVFVIGVALFASASAACGFAANIHQLIAARALQGLGAALAALGLGTLVYGLIESSRLGFGDQSVLVALIGAVVLLALFVIIETRVPNPMLPLAFFRSRTFTGANLLTFLLYGALGGTLFFLPLNLIQVQHYSATAAGAAFLPFILIIFLLSRWAGGLVERYGSKIPLVIVPLIAALGFALFMLPGLSAGYWQTFFPAVAVLGIGMAVSVAPLTTTVMNAVAPNRVGIASGVNNAVARGAGLLAIAVLGIVMLHSFNHAIDRRLVAANVPAPVSQSLQAQRSKLAAASLPKELDHTTLQVVREAIGESFVHAFRLIMAIGAALAVVSAIVAWLFIGTTGRKEC